MRRSTPAFVLCLAALTAAPVFSQGLESPEPPPIDYETAHLSRVVSAVRITEEISLDGRLDEPVWNRALPATDFIQQQPFTGQPAREQTEARFLYDRDNLYIGIICFDSEPDRIVVNELREDFALNESDAITVNLDSLRDRRSGFNFTINPAGAKRDGQISNDGQYNNNWDGVWDVRTGRSEEGWTVEIIIPFKTLRFSSAASQEWGLQMQRRNQRLNERSFWSPIPIRFSAGRMSLAGTLNGLENIGQGRNIHVKPFVTAGVTDARGQERQVDRDAGVDVKYSVTQSLTFDATYRTDFAQVEVDRQQVNLTRFNLFFPEKRDFFLENSGTFTFGGSRNARNLVPFFSRRIGLSDAGTPIPIVGGARLTGQVDQYDVGLLAMKTESTATTPSNNFLVGRIKRNILTNSWVGALVTKRDSSIVGDYNRVYGADARILVGRLELDSYLLRSETPGKAGKDQARKLAIAWRDDEFFGAAEYNTVQANFIPDVGFVRRTDVIQYSGDLSWSPQLTESETIQNLIFATQLDYFTDGAGKLETQTEGLHLRVRFENDAGIGFDLNHTFDRLTDPFRIRRNPALFIAAGDYEYRDYSVNFSTRPSGKITGNGAFDWGEFWDGHRKSFGGGLVVRPDVHLTVDLDYERNQVTLPAGSFTTNLVATRLTYSFTPRALINAFIQYNADTHEVSSNIQFRLTHHPLSDLYLVYNEGRDTTSSRPVERAFIVKLTNLFRF